MNSLRRLRAKEAAMMLRHGKRQRAETAGGKKEGSRFHHGTASGSRSAVTMPGGTAATASQAQARVALRA